jgi:transposase, IS30 family
MKNSGADAALSSFEKGLNRVPSFLRSTLTYDRGKEMARHEGLAKRLKIRVYFCDPRNPWQRHSNENMNGLIRQYLPKGINLSTYSQSDLNKNAQSLNTRPRACLGFKSPERIL